MILRLLDRIGITRLRDDGTRKWPVSIWPLWMWFPLLKGEHLALVTATTPKDPRMSQEHVPYDLRLFIDIYDVVAKACTRNAGRVDNFSDVPSEILISMQNDLTPILDRIYDEGYESGRIDEAQDES